MPFQSQAQRAFMYIHHPEIAKKWSKEYPNQGQLPMHKKKTKRQGISRGMTPQIKSNS